MSTVASRARVRTVASGPPPPQQPRTRGTRGAGSQARRMGRGVQPVPTGVCVGAELLSPRPTGRVETPPPFRFEFNRGVNFIPCVVTNSEGRGVLARYTRVIMGPDPHVIGIIPGDRSQYGGLLYVLPDHDLGERPRYAHNDLWWFKHGANERARLTTRWSTSTTSHSLLRSRESERRPASSLLTKRKSTRSKNACGRQDS